MAEGCGILCAHGSPFDRLRAGLGTTSVLSDGNGQQAGDRVAYLPYGGLRLGDASTLPTDYGFTGQRLEAGLGLMHYGARFYSPRLGRFVSADTIVPQPGNPQALNRYAYVLNNPLRYTDPSGHYIFEDDPGRPQFPPRTVCEGWRFRNPIEVAIANAYLTGDPSYFDAIPPDINAQGLSRAWTRVERELGYKPRSPEPDPAVAFGATYIGIGLVTGKKTEIAPPQVSEQIAVTADPRNIRFSQRSAGGRGRYGPLHQSMTQQGWNGPPIDVVETPEGLVSVDNTRLAIARQLDMEAIPVRIHAWDEPLTADMSARFRGAETWGEALTLRTSSQRPPLSPYGTHEMPRLPTGR